MSTKKVILVDGFALIFKAYYAFISNPLQTSEGKPTSAIFGFMRMLMKTFKKLEPDYIVVALESEEKTFRKEFYPEYKANRSEPPEDLSEQIPAVIEMLEKFQIPSISVPGYEADDVIATLATEYKKNPDIDVYILSNDKDLMQLVGDNVKCITSSRGISDIKILDEQGVKEKLGVTPEKILEFLALTGDSADNIPGVKGVGKKTAAKLLEQFDNIEHMFKHIDRIKGKIKDKIAKSKEDINLSKKLLRLETELDIDMRLSNYSLPDLNKQEGIDFLEKYELTSLLKDPLFTGKAAEKKTNNIKSTVNQEVKTTQEAEKGKYKAITDKNELYKLFDEIKKQNTLSLDTETTDENAVIAELIGVSLCYEKKKAFYIPLKHGVDKNFDNEYFLNLLKDVIEKQKIKLIGQNIKYDYIVLKKSGITMQNVYFDTMIASYILDSSRSQHNLDFLAKFFLGYDTKKYSALVNVKKGETLLDIDFDKVVDYACEDADICLRLYEKFKPMIEKNNLEQIFYEVDMPLVKILGDMEFNGVSINEKQMNEMSKDFEERIEKIRREIITLAGEEFNVNSTQQLSKVLFEDLKLPPKKKTKTGYSTDNQVLQQLKGEHEIIDNVIDYRKLTKIKNTYLDSLPKLVNKQTKKIHATFSQTVTATGRLSSSAPNLQNIPVRGETGSEIRQCFIAPDNYKILSADYSQIELRILAHVTKDEMLVNAYKNGKDIHTQTASLIYGVNTQEVDSEMRANAKTINFAVIYGRGARNLSKDLKISVEEAQEFRDMYFQKYNGVREYIEKVREKASEAGFVRTLFGRVRHLPGYASSNQRDIAQAERIAFNTIIQGTSADIIKIAMQKIKQDFAEQNLKSRLIIQVHDELIFEIHEDEAEKAKKIIVQNMENAAELDVPLRVNTGIGNNWDEAH